MMKHLKENNETYLSHMMFAAKMSIHLLIRSFFFMFHAIFPFINVPESLNLKNTCKLINKWNKYAKKRRRAK
jgi:hypothetical protein